MYKLQECSAIFVFSFRNYMWCSYQDDLQDIMSGCAPSPLRNALPLKWFRD